MKPNPFLCIDCGIDTDENCEYYMVHGSVWPIGEQAGMLCIGCLEKRIGRRLAKKDFCDYPINYIFNQSERLKNRINTL